MGAVHEETLSQNRNCHEWEVINFSEINIIKSLIKNRSEFDTFYQAIMFESKNPFVMNAIPQFHELIECIYLDLDRLIEHAKLTKKHLFIIKRFMLGCTERDIANTLNESLESIRSVFNTACTKIIEQNKFEWDEWLETSGLKKIDDKTKYKRCRKCKRWLRADESNFSPKADAKDKLHPYCKSCR